MEDNLVLVLKDADEGNTLLFNNGVHGVAKKNH